jgi:NAD(P)-dependent dehydrogenase (short-subunit alcohol dehydrogenase family)
MFRHDLLKDKVIVVTGGGTGLGKSMAARFGELGAKLVITSRKAEHLDPAAEEMRAKGIDVLGVTCDVRQPESVEAMVARAVEKFGRVNALVNNAAGNFLCPSEELTYNGFHSVVQIVLYGSFNCTHAVGKQMIKQGTGGSILSIVTTYAWTGSAYVLPSAMAKAGVLVMTRSLAVEWARHKIRANSIAPGPFPTEGAWARLVPGGMSEAAGSMVQKKIPAGRFGRHDELTNLASYLLADESEYVTGDCVTIDGGEWLMAGEFNEFTKYDPRAVAQMMGAMKPGKSKG